MEYTQSRVTHSLRNRVRRWTIQRNFNFGAPRQLRRRGADPPPSLTQVSSVTVTRFKFLFRLPFPLFPLPYFCFLISFPYSLFLLSLFPILPFPIPYDLKKWHISQPQFIRCGGRRGGGIPGVNPGVRSPRTAVAGGIPGVKT